ncbi:LicD family-domain-containing protein, partial [Dipodascopsis uninucleata]
MLRKSTVIFCSALIMVFVGLSTLFSAVLAFLPDSSTSGISGMSVMHEKFYIGPPRQPSKAPPKYFFEAHIKKKKKVHELHYDRRFFKKELSESERLNAIREMLGAWFSFIQENEVESWIAHGTLLGWWWNGEPMPWDVDVDVQMFVKTMEYVSNQYNATTYLYTSEDGSQHSYFLDINPFFVYRQRSNGQNVIDGRFVDMDSGLYIDITALAEADPIRYPNVVSCKNNHKYAIEDIVPLRETLYIGKRVYIPYEFERILIKEYSRNALSNPRYEGHVFSKAQQKWIKESSFR